ncbi:MAG: enoyl-CoA hydratase [Alphaproteobacteria bacterium]|nr:enoyl-CoA hydratase [Alphaproteobacteria bacterium]
MNDTVLLDVADSIATLTLNRPAALNALNQEMRAALIARLAEVEADDRVRCVILRGAGEHFMSGGDIKSFYAERDNDRLAKRRRFLEGINALHPMIFGIRRMAKPVIAEVRGYAAGFGVSLAIACDLTIAAADAKFTLAYVRIGASPDGGASYFLPRLVGLKKALEIALLGDDIDAGTAAAHGMVNYVVPGAELPAFTARLARRLANGPTLAYGNVKRLMYSSLDTNMEAQLQLEAECLTASALGQDFREGVSAFVEKRKPHFQGR